MRSFETIAHGPLFLALTLLGLQACSSTPSVEQIQEDLRAGRVRGRVLDDLGPIRQEEHGYCGPAALAAVATARGQTVTTLELVPETYLDEAHGSFTFDLEHAARQIGLAPRAEFGATIESIARWLDAGVPVIVLRKVGWWPLSTFHYQVAIGYDQDRGLVVIADQGDPGAVLTDEEFLDSWPERYALAVLNAADIAPARDAEHREQSGDIEGALDSYRVYLERFPADLEASYNLARLENERGNFARARSLYEKLLDLHPDDGPAANNLADLLRERYGELERAEQLVRHAIDVDPRNSHYYRETLGEILSARGDPSADAEFQAALDSPRNLDPELRSRLLARLGRNAGPVVAPGAGAVP
jgi:tetratricopeptide (TPR) repeat protein